LAIPRLNKNDDNTYGIELIGNLKYDRIDIISKVVNGINCIPHYTGAYISFTKLPGILVSQTW
jgi:hypothetical protein